MQVPSPEKLNGPLNGYTISYKEAGMAATFIKLPFSSTRHILTNLKKWTDYVLQIKVANGDYEGPWSAERRARTKQDGFVFCAFIQYKTLKEYYISSMRELFMEDTLTFLFPLI